MPPRWKVRLSDAARKDFDDIYLWTEEHFGIDQARHYRDAILNALQILEDGPDAFGTRKHLLLEDNFRVLHVARSGRRARHFIVFDGSMTGRIQVIRILHDSMDLARHVTADDETEH